MNIDYALPALGTPFAGGIFAGYIILGGLFQPNEPYALVVAPKHSGEIDETAWGPTEEVVDACDDENGRANTFAMARAGSTLAIWARNLRIGGHDDWFLPSRVELFTAWIALRETKEFSGERYWSSTQYRPMPEFAWIQECHNGAPFAYRKSCRRWARAVRKVPISFVAVHSVMEAA